MNNDELLKYFEKISGSYKHRLQYEEVTKELVSVQERRNEISRDIKNFKAQKGRCDKNIQNGSEYHRLTEEFDNIGMDMVLAKLLECDIKSNHLALKKGDLQSEIKKMER